MRRPVDSPYQITTEFGVPDSYAKFGYHSGVDYYLPDKPVGSPIHAPIRGSIVYAQMHPTGGNMVVLFDGQFYHRLMHNNSFNVSQGQNVNEGDVVAYSGTTGLATGPHCHWDIATQQSPTAFSQFIPPADWLAGQYAPVPPKGLEGYQRQVGAEGVNERTAPNLSGDIFKEWPAGEILDFKGYVKGELYAGQDNWFVGRYNGRYFWSGAFTDTATHDLPNLTETSQPSSTPIPTPAPVPIGFTADSPLVKEVIPSPNFKEGDIVPSTIIVHQWDDPAKNPTFAGVKATFLQPDGISPHYVVYDSGIYQFVKESNRAWHAGPNGNGIGIGIEFDPNMTEVGYQNGRNLIADIRKRKGNLTLTGHNIYQPTQCPKYINMARLEPVIEDHKLEERLTVLEKAVKAIQDFLSSIFSGFKR